MTAHPDHHRDGAPLKRTWPVRSCAGDRRGDERSPHQPGHGSVTIDAVTVRTRADDPRRRAHCQVPRPAATTRSSRTCNHERHLPRLEREPNGSAVCPSGVCYGKPRQVRHECRADERPRPRLPSMIWRGPVRTSVRFSPRRSHPATSASTGASSPPRAWRLLRLPRPDDQRFAIPGRCPGTRTGAAPTPSPG
jgi:hypothetical protein